MVAGILVLGRALIGLAKRWIGLQNHFVDDVLKSLIVLAPRSAFVDCADALMTGLKGLLKREDRCEIYRPGQPNWEYTT